MMADVILWRCPQCGGTDPDTGQSARYCGRTKVCTTVNNSRGIVTSTPMERWEYTPVRKVEGDVRG